ncbi:MAG: NAD(P)/FAD-dependent oxidoreductase [Elusimicrobiota bacterium]|nr:NAD(P)/FAD-dependent oxidoreductase [Elusimicrobiota bacterium]
MNNQNPYDVLIIGGGPAGMIAAIKAGEGGLKTIVLEKKSHPCIKLSITGKGKCNFTNSADIKEFVKVFRNGEFLYKSLFSFSNSDLISFFENLNVPCILERGGRYFPASSKATDIVNALIKQTKKFSKIISSFNVASITKTNDLFRVFDDRQKEMSAKNIIIATGGISYPNTGSTGDGYIFAQSFGHTIKPPTPALVPIILDSKHLKTLNGLKLKNIEVSLYVQKEILAKEFGDMEFSIDGATGPTILTISALVGENAGRDMQLSINLKPALTRPQLEQRLLRELEKFGKYQLKEMLKELLPLGLIKPFINIANLQMTKPCSQITKDEREKILSSLFSLKFKVSGVKNIKEAIVTRGGVCVDEIYQNTMQSKLVKGLYFCGEVIDIDAPTGGFNLQAAFSTGFLAGISVANCNQE